MFASLRQQRAVSPVPPVHETPKAIPSIKLTTATPVASSSSSATPLAPRTHDGTARKVVPKRVLVLHEAPPPLPILRPKVLPVKDHSATVDSRPSSRATSRFGSGASKLKVFVDPSPSIDATPQLVQKKKSRAALDSIKWALGDRTNVVKDSVARIEKNSAAAKEKEPRSSVDSDKEKWKWTLGRSRKEGKPKMGRNCEYCAIIHPHMYCSLTAIFSSSARVPTQQYPP